MVPEIPTLAGLLQFEKKSDILFAADAGLLIRSRRGLGHNSNKITRRSAFAKYLAHGLQPFRVEPFQLEVLSVSWFTGMALAECSHRFATDWK